MLRLTSGQKRGGDQGTNSERYSLAGQQVRSYTTKVIYKHKEVTMNIYVGNLALNATEGDLQQAFEAFGEVTSAKIIKDKYSGSSKGFGFVEMPAGAEAQSAITGLNEKELKGQALKVNEARPPKNRNSDGGGYQRY
jgi:RNA recognition motif-containing protein